jgi:hypothetical protein
MTGPRDRHPDDPPNLDPLARPRAPGAEPHGAGDPPRDPLADATRRLVVDDHDARFGLEPEPRDPTPGPGLRPPDDPTLR